MIVILTIFLQFNGIIEKLEMEILLTYYVIINGTWQTQIIVTGSVFIVFVSFIPVV